MKTAGVILAGGENRRFPVIKGLVRVGRERIMDRILRVYREVFEEIIISTNSPEHYFCFGEAMVGDLYRQRGPMAGIFSALLNAGAERVFVTACDMPFINPSLLRYIIDTPTDADAVVCSFGGRVHPLFGLYSRNREVLDRIERRMRTGATGLQGLLRELRTEVLGEEEVKKMDSDGSSFVNINTPEDFNKFIGGRICLDSGCRS